VRYYERLRNFISALGATEGSSSVSVNMQPEMKGKDVGTTINVPLAET